MKIRNLENRQNGEVSLSLFAMNVDIDALIRQNLARLLQVFQMSQKKLAEGIGVAPSVINDILAERKPMGKDVMARICRVLNVPPWQFYIDENAPIVRNDNEKRYLGMYREAETLGIAEDVARYEAFLISETKKGKKESPEETTKRLRQAQEGLAQKFGKRPAKKKSA